MYGRYFLIQKLAQGSMAEVFLAKGRDPSGAERNVVIKRMLPHLSDLPEFVAMFLDEARLAARLSHENIIHIVELAQEEGCYYICMEYLPGEDFSNVLRTAAKQRQYVPVHVCSQVVMDAALGLHFAHELKDAEGVALNVVHRDISPSNIYVTYDGQVKVLDFGIAKAEQRMTPNTGVGIVKGKYMYMAPEQARGEPVDRRADVFSLGVSLYEALTLTRPFARETDLAILNAVLKNEFQAPRSVRPDIPEHLEKIVLKAMAGAVEDLYPTAEVMAKDLAAFLGSVAPFSRTLVASFLTGLFGDERKLARTQLPGLSALLAAAKAAPDPLYTPVLDMRNLPRAELASSPPPAKAARDKPHEQHTQPLPHLQREAGRERAEPKAGPEPQGVGSTSAETTDSQTSRRRPGAFLLPAVAALLLAGGVGFVALLFLPPDSALGRLFSPGPAVGDKGVQTRILTVEEAERVVSLVRPGMSHCVEALKAQGVNGVPLSVDVRVASSGKVTAETRAPYAQTGIARCLEGQLERLQFPPQEGRELRFTLPVALTPRPAEP